MSCVEIYNSLSRKAEKFTPRSPKEVKMYTCGPTVYARPHMGNFRTYVFEDALKRYLRYSGYRVRHVMNITDIDDTVMKETRKTGISRAALTRKYERLFRQDASALGIIPAGSYPHVSNYVERMAETVQKLMEKRAAYKDDKCRVFFDISRFPSYGKLAGVKIRGERKVAREEYKPFQAGDFLLLSRCREENCEKCFETSMGKCKPAWNVQCATMAAAELGGNIDISMGGQDNLFNHHENTRAVADTLCGHEFSKYYMHVRHLILDGKKMSKSKGNVVLLPDLLARGFTAREARMLLLSAHYRRRLNFTWEYARKIKMRSLGMRKAVNELKNAGGGKAGGNGREGFPDFADDAQKEFEASLSDNMDIPSALDVAERFARQSADAGLSKKQARAALMLLGKFDSVLACLPL
ncbi:MAG: class I tRNA ligase family protein [Candidatus Micrarchaeia archaeon]|jgi:cysteinyl-tRNA synthetase